MIFRIRQKASDPENFIKLASLGVLEIVKMSRIRQKASDPENFMKLASLASLVC